MRLASSVSLGCSGDSFALSSVANLVADWDPIAPNVTKDGSDKVSVLSDTSGSGHHFLQASGAAQPTWVSSLATANGAPALLLSGAQFMQLATNTQLNYERTQPWTMVFVVRVTGAATDQTILLKGTAAQGFGVQLGNGGTVNNIRAAVANSGANRVVADGATTLLNTTRILRVSYAGNSLCAGITMRSDGTSLGVGATVDSLSASSLTALLVTLGHNQIASFLTGYFIRGAIYDRVLSADEGTLVERFLGSKYGVTVA